MAVISGPKPVIPRPEGHQIPGALAKHVVLDPGIAYTAADALLFLGTNIVGAIAMIGAVVTATALKAASVLQPSFLDKHPKIKELANDDRVPLRAGGLAMLVVTGATIATGAWLPAAASFFFAIANFGLANSVSKQHIAADKKMKPHIMSTLEKAKSIFTRPDIYLNIGFGLAGLMAGGAAMAILPLVGAAFWLGTKNTLEGKPEYAGHPKLITGAAAVLFAGVGFLSGHPLIATAHLINGLALGEMERRMTPGGMKQILPDIGACVKSLLGLGRDKPKPAPAPRQPEPVLPYKPFPANGDLSADFGVSVREVEVKNVPAPLFRPQVLAPA